MPSVLHHVTLQPIKLGIVKDVKRDSLDIASKYTPNIDYNDVYGACSSD